MINKEKTMKLKHFYSKVMDCSLTPKECLLAVKSKKTGDAPRGFLFKEGIRPDILVVAKNPGTTSSKEKEYYKGKSGQALIKSHLKFNVDRMTGKFQIPSKIRKFQPNRRRYLLYILDIHKKLMPYKEFIKDRDIYKDEEQIAEKCFFTNLFKCSTEDKRITIHNKDFSTCYNEHFKDELEIINPKVIIAAGREVNGFLTTLKKQGKLSIPFVKVKHFSLSYSLVSEKNELKKIKTQVQKLIRNE